MGNGIRNVERIADNCEPARHDEGGTESRVKHKCHPDPEPNALLSRRGLIIQAPPWNQEREKRNWERIPVTENLEWNGESATRTGELGTALCLTTVVPHSQFPVPDSTFYSPFCVLYPIHLAESLRNVPRKSEGEQNSEFRAKRGTGKEELGTHSRNGELAME